MPKHTHDILRERLLTRAGVIKPEVKKMPSIAELRRSEWSPTFERLMRNRLVIGAFRYLLFEEYRKKWEFDCASEAIRRIEEFQKTGNTEHLVDAANMCLIEFEFSNHPKKHFSSVDDGMHNSIERKK